VLYHNWDWSIVTIIHHALKNSVHANLVTLHRRVYQLAFGSLLAGTQQVLHLSDTGCRSQSGIDVTRFLRCFCGDSPAAACAYLIHPHILRMLCAIIENNDA
jgi:hypothetical protein